MSIPTPLETSGGPYTTYAEEIAFYEALTAASPRFAYESIGTSEVLGRDMWFVRVGAPGPATPGTTDSILITASQHGNEFAARETVIKLIRDLAFTEDPALVQYLAEHPLFFMPTCNPDQIEGQERNNAANENLNRDHFALTQGETVAIAEAIRWVKPGLVYDVHEYKTINPKLDLHPIPPSHPQIGEPTLAIGQELYDLAHDVVTGAGYSFGPYTFASVTLPTMLVNAASLLHGVPAFTPETCALVPLDERMTIHRLVLDAMLEWHGDNAARINAHTAESIRQRTRQGENAQVAYKLMDSPIVMFPPPSGYVLTEQQYADIALQREKFELVVEPHPDGWFVPMGQRAQPAIPLMFDPQSPYVVAVGVAVAAQIPGSEIVEWGPVKVNGSLCPVNSVSIQVDGALRPIAN